MADIQKLVEELMFWMVSSIDAYPLINKWDIFCLKKGS